jgi:hypothetical protein
MSHLKAKTANVEGFLAVLYELLGKAKENNSLICFFNFFLLPALSNRKQETRETNIFTDIVAQRHYGIILVEKQNPTSS